MKKIKSNVIYVNPSYKTSHRIEKSPSPDNKNRSKMQRTNSPIKQVEQYYKTRDTIGYYCTEVQKTKQKDFHGKNVTKGLSSFSVNDSSQIDMDSISESIKLKSPSSHFRNSQSQFSSSKQYFSSNFTNQSYQTPKSKNTSFNHEFPSNSIEQNNVQNPSKLKQNLSALEVENDTKINSNLGFGTEYYSTIKGERRQSKQSPSNKKSKKKLELFSPSFNASSNQKPTKDSPQKSQLVNSRKQFPSQYQTGPSQKQKQDINKNKQTLISQLQNQLMQKERQIKKMSIYVKQYEKLGTKNKKMEKEMSQILTKLYEIKQKKQQSLSNSRQIQSHNQLNQDQQTPSSNHENKDKFYRNPEVVSEQSLSEIEQQNKHHQTEHRKSLTDDYIKIYDDLESSAYLNVEEEQQSYKPNLMNYINEKPMKKDNSVYSNRKMPSVGARLKESLKAKNQDFKAHFDDSILLSSSSSELLPGQLRSPKQKEKRQYDFTKKNYQNLKTQETEEGSISFKQNQSNYDLDSSMQAINIKDKFEQTWNFKNEQLEQSPSLDLAKQVDEEETTAKKSKVKFVIKKRSEQNVLTDKNVDYLVQTNKKLTSIIQNLMKSHDSMFEQVKRMSEKNQVFANKMIQIQQEFYLIKVNFGQLTAVSNEILNTIKENFSSTFSFKNNLTSIQEKLSKLYQTINQNARQIKRENSKKQIWMESNHTSNKLPQLSKLTSFGRPDDIQANHSKKDHEERVRKQSGSEYRQLASPSFTYLEESASFLTESFKLSHSDRSNPSNSRFNYSSTVEDQICSNQFKHSSMKSSKKELKYEQESKILIKEESIDGSSDSNLLSYPSNGTSQFLQVQSGRGISQKSGTSKDKIRSQNSEIRINFDDLYEDPNVDKQNFNYQKFEIINHQTEVKSSRANMDNFHEQGSISLMKSSFGPIIQKEMSYSQKGDSIAGQIYDQVHEFSNDSPHRAHNRPRQNSSINIFFSSDSICKSSKGVSSFYNETPLQKHIEQNISSQSTIKSVKCMECHSKDEQINSLNTEASQMRKIISQLNEEKDGLQKLIKSKIEIIDNLQISLKELQSLSSFENIKPAETYSSYKSSEKIKLNNEKQLTAQEPYHPWYKSVNDFQYLEKFEKKPSVLDMKPKKLNQIEDLLPISGYLSKQVPSERLQSLKSIELEIQKQLRKEKQLQKEFNQKNFRIESNTLDWGKGSFSNIDQFRQKSFIKTKAILVRLICVIRELISENNQSLLK